MLKIINISEMHAYLLKRDGILGRLQSLKEKTTTSKSAQSSCSLARPFRNTMTDVTTRIDVRVMMTDVNAVKKDIMQVRECVKEELFCKIIFIHNAKQLKEGEKLYSDYETNCVEVLSNGMLKSIPISEAKLYLKFLWMKMTQDKCCQEWVALKRSNAHQAAQDKFHGK